MRTLQHFPKWLANEYRFAIECYPQQKSIAPITVTLCDSAGHYNYQGCGCSVAEAAKAALKQREVKITATPARSAK